MEALQTADWYIIYTKSLREKKVVDYFSQKNIKNYCPLTPVKIKSRGLEQTTYEPLFPSYVFVNVASSDLERIKAIPDVVGLVFWLGEPARIRHEEIAAIGKFTGLYKNVEIEKIPVVSGGTIAVMYSPVPHLHGILPGAMSGFVKMQLPSLGCILKAKISRELIKWDDILQLTNNQQTSAAKLQAS